MNRENSNTAVIYYAGFRNRSGGAFKHALVTAGELQKRGWRARVITLDNLPVYARYLPTILGKIINIMQLPMGYAYRGRLTAFLYKNLLNVNADFIIFEEIYTTWNSSIPSITMLHATWSDNLQGIDVKEYMVEKLVRCEEDILNDIRHPVITVSEEYRNFLINEMFGNQLNRNIVAIPLSIGSPEISEGITKGESIVFMGRLEPRKNLFFLIDSFETFHSQNDGVSLTIIGDGPLEAELRALVAKKNLPVRFLGRLKYEEIFSELAKHKVYVHTSTKESFSFSLLEAKLCGLATCAYANLTVPRSFIDYPVESFSVEEWVRALEVAFERGPINLISHSDYSPKTMIDGTLRLAGFKETQIESRS